MVGVLYCWAKGEKDQLGKPAARGSTTQGTSGADSGDGRRASAIPTGSDDHRHYTYLGFWAAGVDGGRPTGAATDSQLQGKQLAQCAGAPLVSPAEAALVSPAAAPTLQLNAPGCGKNTPAGTSAASGPSVNCTPAVGGASTLAELNAITVTN